MLQYASLLFPVPGAGALGGLVPVSELLLAQSLLQESCVLG